MDKTVLAATAQLINQTPLQQVVALVTGDIVRVTLQAKPVLPATESLLYLHIHSHPNEALPLIKQLMADQNSVVDHHAEQPLAGDLLRVMLRAEPQLVQRCLVDDRKEGMLLISSSNSYAINNLAGLCLLRIQQDIVESKQFELLRDYLLPLYVTHGHSTLSKVAANIVQVIVAMSYKNGGKHKAEILMFFMQSYHRYWQTKSVEDKNMRAVESHLTLIEQLHHDQPFSAKLISQPGFRQQTRALLTWKGEGTGHRLAPKVFQHYARSVNDYNTTTQIFLNLYGALSCYGAHLARDAWPSFFTLLQQPRGSVFSINELAEILLVRVEKHQNNNVIKNCAQAIIESQESNKLFEKAPQLVYGKVVKLLGLGCHYLDCFFHMDSRIYGPICNFFVKYLDQPLDKLTLEHNLSCLLEAILKRNHYDHALIAQFRVFGHLKCQSEFLKAKQVQDLRFLLMKGYPFLPLRKRFQLLNSMFHMLQNHLCREEVTIDQTARLLLQVNPEYLVNNNEKKYKRVLEGYGGDNIHKWSTETVNQIKSIIESRKGVELQWELLNKIKTVKRIVKLTGINLTQYYNFLNEMMTEYGESSYKSQQERELIILIYNYTKSSIFDVLPEKERVNHIEQACNNVVHYCGTKGNDSITQQVKQIASFIFGKAYQPTANPEDSEPKRIVVARMLEWAYDQITPLNTTDIIIQALKARVIVLRDRKARPQKFQGYQVWLQQTAYALLEQFTKYDKQPPNNVLANLTAGKRLRVRLLLSTAMMSDPKSVAVTVDQITNAVDCYDFQYYEEVCWWIEATYSRIVEHAGNLLQRINEQEAQQLVKQLSLMLDNMLHNLEYSLGRKEALGIVGCTCHLFFLFAQTTGSFSPALSQFILQMFRVGDNSILFHRALVFHVGNFLDSNAKQAVHWDLTHFKPVITQALCVEQYRGYDSALQLHSSAYLAPFYESFGPDLEGTYLGAAPRFALLHLFHSKLIPQAANSKGISKLCTELMEAALGICLAPLTKERMFLSGKIKTRLKMWQFLLAYPLQFFKQALPDQQTVSVLTRCIGNLSLISIGQIRSYSDLFLLRIVFTFPQLVNSEMLGLLEEGLLATSSTNVNKSLSHMVIAGLVLQHITSYVQQHHQFLPVLKPPLESLFNSLLTYVGSSVAYLRGLSQYFCLHHSTFLSTPYVQLLRQNYLMDKDALILRDRLISVMQQYLQFSASWSFEQQIIRKLPNNNGNVTTEQHFVDSLKYLGTQLLQTNKNQDGYTAYRHIWRRNVPQSHQGTLDEGEEEIQEEEGVEESTLQTKIDPAVDFSQHRQSHLQIMLISPNSPVLAGHLSRTGEIFGLNRLIIPEGATVSSDQYKSISVTAQKWLNIVGMDSRGNKLDQAVVSFLIECKSQGYTIIRLRKSSNHPQNYARPELARRTLLVIDEQGLLEGAGLEIVDGEVGLSSHLSMHVEGSIVVWQYYRKYLLE